MQDIIAEEAFIFVLRNWLFVAKARNKEGPVGVNRARNGTNPRPGTRGERYTRPLEKE